ncbi:hypothetical protein T459_27415 [Capsicum annuum]|uniref:Uncharacterized protein n=1 Tax=Capsicum annuum TaxID=4072 RepID=A0A2G2YDV9_CAPAN|nr:hypothetical protein T459_27415 [Capsicum annuum]
MSLAHLMKIQNLHSLHGTEAIAEASLCDTGWVADDSHYSFKTVIHLDDDGEYIEEVENDEEDILGEEFEEYDDDRELVDAFTKDQVGAGILQLTIELELDPPKNIRLVKVQRDRPQNLDCTPKYCRNFILKSRSFEMQEGEAQSLLNFFREMQLMDWEFLYSIDVDKKGRLPNVVRVHSVQNSGFFLSGFKK